MCLPCCVVARAAPSFAVYVAGDHTHRQQRVHFARAEQSSGRAGGGPRGGGATTWFAHLYYFLLIGLGRGRTRRRRTWIGPGIDNVPCHYSRAQSKENLSSSSSLERHASSSPSSSASGSDRRCQAHTSCVAFRLRDSFTSAGPQQIGRLNKWWYLE